MLRGIDKALELLGWIAALGLVIMLFVGPQVVAEDEPAKEGAAGAAPYAGQAAGGAAGGSAPADGKTVFNDRCGSCHTLSAAGASGSVGPNLDDNSLDAAAIEGIVRDGRGSMPALGGELSDGEITAVAEFVAGN
jgi:mono/diheme cytochrome c family protein